MNYLILAKNNETNKYDIIGESETGIVSNFEIIGKINHLNLFQKKDYSYEVKVIKREELENF